ncbi:hypothetical protein G4Z16_01045 [Streptomyces bathyalis]|uniref:Uncharacterized protein n=1 Tax=Streptomyces bathyalis TaxID=2710756 RepID=A0A7T1T2I1_9ACTN|nr:hypothetical protein [Streptomyces bathyalis]QPP05204.1 hypothetical protein G4Z16_01045 [Streptomyces bathyalis]
MSIDEHVASCRQQMTGESLRRVRLSVKELADWSALLPTAEGTQPLLESLFLKQVGTPSAPNRYPLGIERVVAAPRRLEVRFEQPELVRPVLQLLPWRDRRRSRHGIADLWATAVGGSIEIAFARRPTEGVIAVSSIDGTDLGQVLAEHESSVEERQCTPLWSIDPSTLPEEPLRAPGRRRKPRPATEIDHHRSAAHLASAILRRIRLWDRLGGHAQLHITPEVAAHGLDWQITRELHPKTPVHDERLTAVLQETVVGLGLVASPGHQCGEDSCVAEFTAPSERLGGWSSVLSVHTSRTQTPATAMPRKPRHFTALGEAQFPSRASKNNGSDTSMVVPEPLPRSAEATPSKREPQGRCTQLLAPRFGISESDLQRIATQLGAAWALQGCRVLVLTCSFGHRRTRKPLRGYPEPEWPSTKRPINPAPKAWNKLRLAPGTGELFAHTSREYLDERPDLLAAARAEFDWIIFVDRNNRYGTGPYVEELADSYVVLVDDAGYEDTVVITEAHGGVATPRRVPVSAAESAMAWRHAHLTGIPFDRIPVAGLVLQPARRADTQAPRNFVERTDAELERYGTPVLARLPRAQTTGLAASSRTVLDDVDDEYRNSYLAECRAIRRVLTEAQPCTIPPLADEWA